MAAPNVPPRRVSMSYLLGFSKTPFKDPKPLPAYQAPRPGGLGDMVRTPGGIVEWAASDGRKGKLMGPGKTRASGEGEPMPQSEKGAQVSKGKAAEKKEEGKPGNDGSSDGENPHGFTPEQDERMIEWKAANSTGPWKLIADEIGKEVDQCKERYSQIKPKDDAQNTGAQHGGLSGGGGGGGGQQNQQSQPKLTKKEKKAPKKEGSGGRNQNQGQRNNTNQGQNSGGSAEPSGNSSAGQGDIDNPFGMPGFVTDETEEKESEGGKQNDLSNPWATWGAPKDSGNAGESPGWPADASPGGWGGVAGSGDNKYGGSTKGDKIKKENKDKKEKTDRSNGSKKDGDNWKQTEGQSGGGNGWGDGPFNSSGAPASTSQKTVSNKAASNNGDGGAAWGGVDGSNNQPGGWSGSQQKAASSKGGFGGDTWGAPADDGAKDTNVQAWDAAVPQNVPPANNGGPFANTWDTTAPPAPSVKKAPSNHHSHKSTHRHSSYGHQSSKDRTAAPLELEIKPDETFSADDLRLVARILQQDYQMVWQRVSWRFKDKTGRTVSPEVFEKKITGRGGPRTREG